MSLFALRAEGRENRDPEQNRDPGAREEKILCKIPLKKAEIPGNSFVILFSLTSPKVFERQDITTNAD